MLDSTITLNPSFPRRRESNFGLSELFSGSWIPACAGMTVLLFCLLFHSNILQAQDASPTIGSQATEGPYRILIIGDAMGGGMGGGLTRMAAAETGYQVVNRFNEASALSRPDRYDWAAAIPKMMEGKNFSAAVVLIGLNDRQDIRTPTGRLPFNSPEWIAAYKANVDAVIDALLAQDVKIIWLGQPPMGDPAYDADMQVISALQKERAIAKNITFVELRAPFLGPDGRYSQRGPDDTGIDQKLRQNDGVTFFKLGNNRIGQIVLAALKNGAPPPTAPLTPSSTLVAVAPSVVDDAAGPVFGQQDQNGQEILHSGSDVVASVETQNANTAAIAASSIGVAAAAGTSAEKLFTLGIAPLAPIGRFDDFTYTAPTTN